MASVSCTESRRRITSEYTAIRMPLRAEGRTIHRLMNRLAWILLAALAGCSKPPAEAAVEKLSFETLGSFEYKDKMALPESVARWNGKLVQATGFMNPLSQTRNLTNFLLV